ncbi:MAG: TspO/MBR family protein [Methanosarcina sp.]
MVLSFFGQKSSYYAFVEIILLWVAVFLTILKFRKISKIAFDLLLPYIVWASFAMLLNCYI